MKIIKPFLPILLVILFISGCKEDNPMQNEYSVDTDFKLMDTNNVEKTIFRHGENIQFFLRIRNTGNDFTFGKGTCEYGIFSIYKDGAYLGSHTDGIFCHTVYTTWNFSKNIPIENSAFWVIPNLMSGHTYPEPGNYKAVVKSSGIYNHDKQEPIVFEKFIDFTVTE